MFKVASSALALYQARADVVTTYPSAFLIASILSLTIGLISTVEKTRPRTVRLISYLHLWTYLLLLFRLALTSMTTAIVLNRVCDATGKSKIDEIIPTTLLPLAAALLGVLGFEGIIKKVAIAFGDNQLDFATPLQQLMDQAVAATIQKDLKPFPSWFW